MSWKNKNRLEVGLLKLEPFLAMTRLHDDEEKAKVKSLLFSVA